eukprot:TRINITY_DN121_c0_g1_i1.p1 TRINITY_DN121_c0_g1~~TRINITY_DN121_c0_g1_i1.p1  ORF type:complete len:160 (-),score=54.32 TRINITY_DN121_c0_g1_i1:34-513(-)
MTIKAGDAFPKVTLTVMGEKGPQAVQTEELFANKKVVIFGLPGAFTPGCSATHCPSFVRGGDALKAKGVDLVVCVATNDVFVMDAWGEHQKGKGKITFLSDSNLALTKAAGLELDLSAHGLGVRMKRFAAVVDNNTIKYVAFDEKEIVNTVADALIPHL